MRFQMEREGKRKRLKKVDGRHGRAFRTPNRARYGSHGRQAPERAVPCLAAHVTLLFLPASMWPRETMDKPREIRSVAPTQQSQ